MKKQNGFSLIELMVAVEIVGIIAAFAYPSYQEQVRKTRRADCSGALMGLANALERSFTVNNTYLRAGTAGGNTGAPTIYPATCPIDGGTPTYNLSIQAVTVSTFTIQAAPIGAQANDKCGNFTLTNTGLKSVNGQQAGLTCKIAGPGSQQPMSWLRRKITLLRP